MLVKQIDEIMEYSAHDQPFVLCVDFFDTIVSRKYSPEEIKRAWARQCIDRFRLPISYDTLYLWRRQIEDELYADKSSGYEFTYDTMIKKLYRERIVHYTHEETLFTESLFIDFSIQCEIEIEMCSQYLNDDVIQTIREHKDSFQAIIVISDFYFGKQYLKKFLEKQKVDDLFNDIFVSCDFNKSKKHGSLYEEVKERYKGVHFLMVGDNRTVDYNNSRKNGFEAILVERKRNKDYYDIYDKNAKKSVLKELMRLYHQRSMLSNYIFSLYLFIDRLYHQLLEDQVTDAFFLSRDGEFLMEIFNEYQKTRPYYQRIETHYLLVSRNASYLPSLKPLNEEDFHVVFRQYPNICLHDFLSTISFSEDEIEEISKELEWDKSRIINDGPIGIKVLVENQFFANLYESKRVDARRNFLQYLNDTTGGKRSVALVDVGWKGSIQDNIYNVFDGEKILMGYYYGLNACQETATNIKKGIVFSENPKSDYYWIFGSQSWFVETVLTGSHKRVNGYNQYCDRKIISYADDSDSQLYEMYIKKLREEMREKFYKLNTIFICTRFCPEDLLSFFIEIHYKLTRFYPLLNPEEYFMYQALHSEGFGILKNIMPNETRLKKIKYVLSDYGIKYPLYVTLEYLKEFYLKPTPRK